MAGFRIAHVQREEPPRRRPAKKSDYLAWLHNLQCCVTGVNGVEAAHVSFPAPWYAHYGRGKGTKAPDLFALPVSPDEHRRQHNQNEREYWAEKGIDPHLLGLTLWAIYSNYDEPDATDKARARINAGLALAGRLREREI